MIEQLITSSFLILAVLLLRMLPFAVPTLGVG